MAEFIMEEFVANPSLTQLEKCTKGELREVAAHYSVSVSSALSKGELKAVLFGSLCRQGVRRLPAPEEAPDNAAGAVAAVTGAWMLRGGRRPRSMSLRRRRAASRKQSRAHCLSLIRCLRGQLLVLGMTLA
ncbi:hypothetical protein VZT92_022904 [Zoarces viviparus]|uniref:Uncharacterized protein n=1 Tax=Zoarces viviparus TaxID=48416 RepID=A0AAW1E4Y7_ZOAVI